MFTHIRPATDSARACSLIGVRYIGSSQSCLLNRQPSDRTSFNGDERGRAKDTTRRTYHATSSSVSRDGGTAQRRPHKAQLLDSTIQPFGGILTETLESERKSSSTGSDDAVVPTSGRRKRGPIQVVRPAEHNGSKLWRALKSKCPRTYTPMAGRHKVDLSYVAPRTYEALGRKALELGGKTKNRSKGRNAISKITADYLQELHVGHGNEGVKYQPDPDGALLAVFSDKNMSFLRSRGYDVEDVLTWAWILTSRTADQAVTKILLTASGRVRPARGTVPIFVILQVLRARFIGAQALKDLLHIIQGTCWQSSSHEPGSFRSSTMATETIVVLVVRLLRHARIVAPALLDEIANLACTLLISRKTDPDAIMEPTKAQKLCYVYNRILSLLALPTSSAPYRMVSVQQQAQFRLLRSMMEFKPQLPVTREGYRAMVKLQIAHRKIDSERKWALAKAASWPPWRDVKLGIEEDVDYPGKRSRASEILVRQNQAGYTHLHYERYAQVLAGWDTDKSPTIQKRTLVPRGMLHWLQSTFTHSVPVESTVDHLIWTARIESTRTAREAWACFCSYDQAVGIEGRTLEPYRAIFNKLFAKPQTPDRETHAVPGDGREVYAEPVSSRDQVFVPSEPPEVRTFYEKMLQDKIKPAGRLLAELIDHASSLAEGLKYIEDSRFTEIRKDLLLNAHKYSENTVRDILNNLPDYFLAAFMRLLGRFSDESDRQWLLPRWISTVSMGNAQGDLPVVPARVYAFHLLDISGSQYTPAWNAILQANKASKPRSGLGQRSRLEMGLDFQNIHDRMRAHHVQPDRSTFVISFSHFEDSILGRDMTPSAWHLHFQEQFKAANATLGHAKRLFAMAVGSEDRTRQSWLSWSRDTVVISAPPPIVLQMIISLLGCARDIQGIMEVVRWMDRFSADLAQIRNDGIDMRYLRRSLILVRLFLEQGWFGDEYTASDMTEAEWKMRLHEARDLVERHADWGGWPEREDVREYLHDKEKWVKRIEKAARVAEASMEAQKEQSHSRQRPKTSMTAGLIT